MANPEAEQAVKVGIDLFALFQQSGDVLLDQGRSLARELQLYRFALAEMHTKLSVLQDEITLADDYNPIEHIASRIKTPQSIADKLRRRGHPLTLESMQDNLDDVAGMRVICTFVSDVYRLKKVMERHPDVTILKIKDYIAHPKPNGYRGLHVIVETPVHLAESSRLMRVEIQFRTIAMDFWASLEHKIYYKYDKTVPTALLNELTDAAEHAHELDLRMEAIHRQIHGPQAQVETA